MLPTRRGSDPQPPDHQSNAHPAELPRLAYLRVIDTFKIGYSMKIILFLPEKESALNRMNFLSPFLLE